MMKKDFGKTIRKIREGKQMKQIELVDENLSKSQVSRFENGETEINAYRLINILDKLNISMEEFLIIHDQDETHVENFASLIQFIGKERMAGRMDTIKELLTDSSPFTLLPKERTMVKSIISTIDPNIAPTTDELKELTDYLFKVEYWGYYELILLGNCASTINYPTLFLLTKEMLKNPTYSSLNKTNKKLVIQLAINCLLISVDNNEQQHGTYLVTAIEQLLLNEPLFFEKTVFLYAKGYYDYQNGLTTGIQQMKDAIHIFELLGEDNLAAYYQDHFKRYV